MFLSCLLEYWLFCIPYVQYMYWVVPLHMCIYIFLSLKTIYVFTRTSIIGMTVKVLKALKSKKKTIFSQTFFFPGKSRQHECDIDLFSKCTQSIARSSDEGGRVGQVPGKQSRRWII